MTRPLILAIDQGTTSSRVILFDRRLAPVAVRQREFPLAFPQPGWVEADAERIASDTLELCQEAIAVAAQEDLGTPVAAAITNQRETVVLWERASGKALAPAIVWQDRRTASACERLRADGKEPWVRERTGLLLDPYFSATKIAWLLDHLPEARTRAQAGELAVGTIDCWLAYRFSNGQGHVTEASNAARTLLWDLEREAWHPELLQLFDIPAALLPKVLPSAAPFAELTLSHDCQLPLLGMIGDQQAAAIGQACFAPGSCKCTYGTGAFLVQSTGTKRPPAAEGLLDTALLGRPGSPLFAVEGSIFSAGTTLQWLQDTCGIETKSGELDRLAAAAAEEEDSLYLVPAFTGLGAPHWDPHARGMITGLSRASTRASLARAALEASAFRTRDLFLAAHHAGVPLPTVLRIDGGMANSDWFSQRLADLCGVEVQRPHNPEATARGAAMLAAVELGWWTSVEAIPPAEIASRFHPVMSEAERDRRYAGWRRAVASCRDFAAAGLEARARPSNQEEG